jgi:hypothetical protein
VAQLQPSAEIKSLDFLVGTWRTEGQTVPSPAEPSIDITGTDQYEWLDGGFFLVHHVDVHMGADHVKTLEIIGDYDRASQTYAARSFDNQGNYESMRVASGAGESWTITGESTRATIHPTNSGNTLQVEWERSSDGSHWEPWMDLTLTRRS